MKIYIFLFTILLGSCFKRTGLENIKWQYTRWLQGGEKFVSKTDTLLILTDSTFRLTYLTKKYKCGTCPKEEQKLRSIRTSKMGELKFQGDTLILLFAKNPSETYLFANYYYWRKNDLILNSKKSDFRYKRQAKILKRTLNQLK